MKTLTWLWMTTLAVAGACQPVQLGSFGCCVYCAFYSLKENIFLSISLLFPCPHFISLFSLSLPFSYLILSVDLYIYRKDSSTRRQAKNKKYGFGGKKRNSKSNDASSTADVSSFNVRDNKLPFKVGGIC